MTSIKDFFNRIPAGQRANFNELIQKKGDKYDTSVTFASILEMMKERRLDAEQKKLFGDIEVYATEHLMDEVVLDDLLPQEVEDGEQDN